ncbi:MULTISPECIES: hypothetical protein [Bradyrhizobium]|uniref:hypothetical protein n=1 Tax=Bradyrhizobium TaxID=374 RepID=UPI00216837C8|nr:MULTISPECIES: hypothetical protein [Bradyrhizobium]MCS3969435.1 hypothetical protein [Bradyrhizobium japonicum]
MLRFTFDWKDNGIKMIRYVTNEMLKVARAMNPKSIQVVQKAFGDHFDTRPIRPRISPGAPSWARTATPAC